MSFENIIIDIIWRGVTGTQPSVTGSLVIDSLLLYYRTVEGLPGGREHLPRPLPRNARVGTPGGAD